MAKGQRQGSSALQCAGATCVTAIKHETKINFTAFLQADKRTTHLCRKKDTACICGVPFIKGWSESERSFKEPVTLVLSPQPAVVLSLLPPFRTSLLHLYTVFEMTFQ